MSDQASLKRQLQACDFVLYETALYLDSHPDCQKALDYYDKYRAVSEQLRAEYVQQYGPLSHRDQPETADWAWVKGPWPWELEA